MSSFSFDEWADLYKKSPDEFEARRAAFLEEEIMKAPVTSRNTLRMLQIQCNVLRDTLSPLEATVEMSKMMTAKLNELKTPLTQLRAICEDVASSQ